MKVEVLTGPQGGGKTRTMREEAVENPGLYLFAAPTIELIDELESAFKAMRGPQVRVAHSKSKGKGTATARLAFARDEIVSRGLDHAVLITTHETLMSSDLSKFKGWHARIDEAPAAVQAGHIDIRMLREWFKSNFTLDGDNGGEWRALKVTGAVVDWKAAAASPAKALVEFQKQAKHPDRVFVRAKEWDSANEVDWFSMWTPLSLRDFASVQIAGSSYTDSVGYHAAKAIYGDLLDFSEREIRDERTGQPTIMIYYFTAGHAGATTYWGTSDGRLMLKKVCDHLGKVIPASGYWSGNEVVQHLMEHRIKGALIPPTACGLNKHGKKTSCAYIFSAKPTHNDAAIQSAFGMTSDDIRKAREDDAIAQFVMRGAIRDPEYGEPYDIYLYEEAQAERLRSHLERIGFTSVEVVGIEEAGILTLPRHAKRPPKTRPTKAQLAAQKKNRNDKAAERMRKKREAKAIAEGREVGVSGNPELRRRRSA